MRKIIVLILIISPLAAICQDNQVMVYKNYESSIIRQPYPRFIIKDNYIYRTYPNSIIRLPYPEYTIKGNYLYKNYEKSIIRKPYPIGTLDDGIPE